MCGVEVLLGASIGGVLLYGSWGGALLVAFKAESFWEFSGWGASGDFWRCVLLGFSEVECSSRLLGVGFFYGFLGWGASTGFWWVLGMGRFWGIPGVGDMWRQTRVTSMGSLYDDATLHAPCHLHHVTS